MKHLYFKNPNTLTQTENIAMESFILSMETAVVGVIDLHSGSIAMEAENDEKSSVKDRLVAIIKRVGELIKSGFGRVMEFLRRLGASFKSATDRIGTVASSVISSIVKIAKGNTSDKGAKASYNAAIKSNTGHNFAYFVNMMTTSGGPKFFTDSIADARDTIKLVDALAALIKKNVGVNDVEKLKAYDEQLSEGIEKIKEMTTRAIGRTEAYREGSTAVDIDTVFNVDSGKACAFLNDIRKNGLVDAIIESYESVSVETNRFVTEFNKMNVSGKHEEMADEMFQSLNAQSAAINALIMSSTHVTRPISLALQGGVEWYEFVSVTMPKVTHSVNSAKK